METLLRYFADEEIKECFCACLFTCYDLVRPDVALELTWNKHLRDFAMPYLIGILREYTGRIDALDKKTQRMNGAEEKNMSAANDYVPNYMRPHLASISPPGMGSWAIRDRRR